MKVGIKLATEIISHITILNNVERYIAIMAIDRLERENLALVIHTKVDKKDMRKKIVKHGKKVIFMLVIEYLDE